MNRTEILHYLRTNSKVDDKRLIDLIDDCCNEVNKSVRPKTISRIFECTVNEDEVIIENQVFKSKRLAENMKGCKKVCLLVLLWERNVTDYYAPTPQMILQEQWCFKRALLLKSKRYATVLRMNLKRRE